MQLSDWRYSQWNGMTYYVFSKHSTSLTKTIVVELCSGFKDSV